MSWKSVDDFKEDDKKNCNSDEAIHLGVCLSNVKLTLGGRQTTENKKSTLQSCVIVLYSYLHLPCMTGKASIVQRASWANNKEKSRIWLDAELVLN